MRVSVLMTLYNKGAFVEEALRSVLDGSWRDLEVLVVDDASTDDGPDRVRRIGDPRVRLLESPVNTGRPAATNRGWDAARGDYVAVLDADDIARPDRIATQVAFLDAHPGVGAVGSYAQAFGAREWLMTYPLDDAGIRGTMLFRIPMLYPSSMFRRAVVEEHGIRCDPQWDLPGEDHLFLLEVGRHTRYANIPEPLTRYRTGEQNMKHGRDEIADRTALYARQFRDWGIAATAEDIRLQLMLHYLFQGAVTADDVRSLRAWIDRMLAENGRRGLFPEGPFRKEIERRWERLYFHLAPRWPAAALAHVRLMGAWTPGNLAYLAKTTLRRWLSPRTATP